MEKNTVSGLRKGSWTQEEDNLLRACIHQYGEGKWHLVPQRAGLKRCRKSCRMRWLNYLKPNIKRGSFTDDEVDMIRRFHKLLGNRWSLIAGRLPGRTANDVKNFWHTNMRNKTEENQRKKAKDQVMNNNIEETTAEEVVKQHVVIRPQPHTFSKNSPWLRRNKLVSASDAGDETNKNMNASAAKTSSAEPCGGGDFIQRDHHQQSKEWWESLLNKEVDERQVGNFTMMDFWDDDEDFLKMEGSILEGQSSWSPCSYEL